MIGRIPGELFLRGHAAPREAFDVVTVEEQELREEQEAAAQREFEQQRSVGAEVSFDQGG
jgi:hypothetical protein